MEEKNKDSIKFDELDLQVLSSIHHSEEEKDFKSAPLKKLEDSDDFDSARFLHSDCRKSDHK